MNKLLIAFVLTFGLAAGGSRAADQPTHPPMLSNVLFLYYNDVDSAARFYGEVLGLKKTYDNRGVKMYRLSENSVVGLLDVNKGGYYKAPKETPEMMLSIETEHVEEWYKLLKANKEVVFLRDELKTELAHSFLVKDPGGYTVEFFRWANK